MNKSKLMHLLNEEEGFKLDFKLKLALEVDSDKKEFVKDVIAIANTEGGRGYILYGVEDKTKRLVGIKEISDNIEERIQQVIAYRSVPPVPVSFEVVEIKQKQIGVLTIFKSRQVPHQMRQNGAFYVRRGSTTDTATRHELAQMLQEQGIVSFEQVPCRAATLKDLDFNLIERYLKHFNLYEANQSQMLQALGIISNREEESISCPTYGGLLLFGKLPQLFMPHALIEVRWEKDTFGITGNIIEMFRAFDEKIKPLLPSTYPFEALVEILANAIIHRDYWNPYYYTKVEIGLDKIAVINPRQYHYESLDHLRTHTNPWLYSRLLLFEQKDNTLHFGIGLKKVQEIFKETGHDEVETSLQEGFFTVKLPGIAYYS